MQNFQYGIENVRTYCFTDMKDLEQEAVFMDSIHHKYEITITFNPKFYFDNQDMENHFESIHDRLKIKCYSQLNKNGECYYNSVKEYQTNGAPHFHGTVLLPSRMANSTITNWEQFFKREYGKTTIYYTGLNNKVHNNDHFNGTWYEYLFKDNPENYKSFYLLKTNQIR